MNGGQGADLLYAGCQALAAARRGGDGKQPLGLGGSPQETVIQEKGSSCESIAANTQQLGGVCTSPVKGVWAGHQEYPLLVHSERIMVPWLVSILHVAQPAHFTGENLMPRKKN